jgi:hypothetical protein
VWDSVEPSRSGLHRRGDSRALRLQEEYRFQTLAPGQAAQFHALEQTESPSSSRDRDPPRRYEPKTGSLPAPPARASCSAFPVAPPPNRPHSDAAVLTRDATGPASVPFRRHSPLLRRPLNESPSGRRVSSSQVTKDGGQVRPLAAPRDPHRGAEPRSRKDLERREHGKHRRGGGGGTQTSWRWLEKPEERDSPPLRCEEPQVLERTKGRNRICGRWRYEGWNTIHFRRTGASLYTFLPGTVPNPTPRGASPVHRMPARGIPSRSAPLARARAPEPPSSTVKPAPLRPFLSRNTRESGEQEE